MIGKPNMMAMFEIAAITIPQTKHSFLTIIVSLDYLCTITSIHRTVQKMTRIHHKSDHSYYLSMYKGC